jgi:glycerophosphoryl diester phosphodiesterase
VARPSVIAHRGASGHVLENTIEAFELAVGLGADGIELDARRTADHHLVVHHDPVIEGYGLICELTIDRLPVRVPTLQAALVACRGAWVNVEIKNLSTEPGHDPSDAVARSVLETLDQVALATPSHPAVGDEAFVVSSFDRSTLRQIRELAPTMTTALLVDAVGDDVIASCHRNGHRFVHPWLDMLSRDDVVALGAAGLGCNVWTCNDADTMVQLIEWGVDGIITDYPDIARSVIDEA